MTLSSPYTSVYTIPWRFWCCNMPTGGACCRCPDAVRQLMINDCKAGFPVKQVTSRYHVSSGLLYDVRRTYQSFGAVSMPTGFSRRGPKVKITKDAEFGMLDLLE
jgi:hypothetical protein